MDKSLMRECFHNCLDVAPREDDFLVPSRYTPMQCAFYDKIPYASFMGLKARMSAGITLEFDTNAPAFTLQWKIVGGYPLDSADRDSTLDVYVNDVLVAQQTHLRSLPWNETLESSFDLGEGRKRVVVFLPHLLVFALGDIVLPEGNFYLAPVPKRTARVLMIGDSITHRWETDGKKIWSQYFSPYAPVNFGIGGDRTEHVLWRIDDSALKTPHSPQVCVIMVGTNNTGQYKGRQTPQETAEGIREIASRVHRLHPATEIILLHIFPRGKTAEDPLRIQNEMINRELDKTNMPRVHVVNINSAFLDKDGTFLPGITGDLVHLTEKGYRLWADALLPEIKKYMK